MTNGEICTAVNALFRSVCELKINQNKNTLKSQMIFFRDLQVNRRAMINSFVLYEYYASEHITISQDELDLIREFVLTFLEKYDDPNILDVFVHFNNKTLKIIISSYERASKTNNTSIVLREIENDIAKLYENSVFKIIDQIISPLPTDPLVAKIKNIQKSFKSGNLVSKYNESILGNHTELEKYCLKTQLGPIIPDNPFTCYAPFEPYQPSEPSEPFQPFEPSEPSDFISMNYFVNNKNLSFNNESPNVSEANIKAAISKILEITTTEELTQI